MWRNRVPFFIVEFSLQKVNVTKAGPFFYPNFVNEKGTPFRHIKKKVRFLGRGLYCKFKLTTTFLAGEKFDSLFWKNKVDSTQNLTYKWENDAKSAQTPNWKNEKLEKFIFYYITI